LIRYKLEIIPYTFVYVKDTRGPMAMTGKQFVGSVKVFLPVKVDCHANVSIVYKEKYALPSKI